MGFRTSVPDSVSAGLARSHFACRFGLNSVFTELNAIAQHGNYSLETLEQFRSQADVLSNKTLVYGLSSLYLQLGETQRAKQLLNNAGRASREMKRYFSVLRFSSNSDLPCPKLTSQEQNCLDYISAVLSSDELAIAKRILSCGSFSIVGNAPGNDPVTTIEDSCRIFFNNYRENPRINDLASIHVVTPSGRLNRRCLLTISVLLAIVFFIAVVLSGRNLLVRNIIKAYLLCRGYYGVIFHRSWTVPLLREHC